MPPLTSVVVNWGVAAITNVGTETGNIVGGTGVVVGTRVVVGIGVVVT